MAASSKDTQATQDKTDADKKKSTGTAKTATKALTKSVAKAEIDPDSSPKSTPARSPKSAAGKTATGKTPARRSPAKKSGTTAAAPDAIAPDAIAPDAAAPDAIVPDAAAPSAAEPDAAPAKKAGTAKATAKKSATAKASSTEKASSLTPAESASRSVTSAAKTPRGKDAVSAVADSAPERTPTPGDPTPGDPTSGNSPERSEAQSAPKSASKTAKRPAARSRAVPRVKKEDSETPSAAEPSPEDSKAPSAAEPSSEEETAVQDRADASAGTAAPYERESSKEADWESSGNERPSGAADPAERTGDAQERADPADFPTEFGDSGPEDFFAQEGDDAAEEGGRRRRGRTRRGGRGRKKSAQAGDPAQVQQTTQAAQTVADQDDEEAPDDDAAFVPAAGKGRRKMFVSVLPGEQVEVVITEEGQVQEYYVEMLHQAKTKGNIYKGLVNNVDPNLQAAFVSYGAVKNGFLQIDEVHPEYYVAPHEAAKGRKYPPIQKVLKAGQEVLVQVVKEPAGTKGAFLTTYLSMPGRFLVLTPGREQIGVSRKVDNDSERARLRELLEGLTPGPGLGVIVRTVSMGASKTSLQRDLQFLKRTWKEVRARGTTEKAPCLVYQEMELTARAVRDYLNDSIGEVWIDDDETAASVNEVAEALFPRKKNLVRAHKDTGQTLFERFNIQRQLDQIHAREVALPSGGRLVIDPTEALTAIDINSGRSGGKNNFEDMAFRTNMEAAKMIPLQLRLRDIGGQIVADFIEMRDKNHWREVEKTFRNGMKVDRARY
ncbi:MAG: Rne/Rng family ribonuclease, partial [Desulfovibrio sp.]|nr:Rne/Rng family ribonuclease [Desulfovibrio sp.]